MICLILATSSARPFTLLPCNVTKSTARMSPEQVSLPSPTAVNPTDSMPSTLVFNEMAAWRPAMRSSLAAGSGVQGRGDAGGGVLGGDGGVLGGGEGGSGEGAMR